MTLTQHDRLILAQLAIQPGAWVAASTLERDPDQTARRLHRMAGAGLVDRHLPPVGPPTYRINAQGMANRATPAQLAAAIAPSKRTPTKRPGENLKTRLLQVLHDHPEVTTEQLAKLLGHSEGNTEKALAHLFSRGKVSRNTVLDELGCETHTWWAI